MSERIPIGAVLTDLHLSEDSIATVDSIFDQTIEFCADNSLKYIFFGGDLFHSRKAQTQLLLTTFENILDRINAQQLELICIVGNHDKTDYDAKESFLSAYKHHPALQLIEEELLTTDWNGLNIAFLSYYSEEIYIERLKNLTAKIKKEDEVILLTHIGVEGAVMNSGFPVESEIKGPMFKKFKKVYVGHYHDEQEFGNVHYIGSSRQHDFGETPNKGMKVLYNDGSMEHMDLAFPKYTTYQIAVKDLTNKDLEDLKELKENTEDFIRVQLLGEEKDLKAYNVQALKALGIKVDLKQEDINIAELQTRIEPFNPDTLVQQFKSFCEENKLNEEVGMEYFKNIIAQSNV